jgi:hypothetical protein
MEIDDGGKDRGTLACRSLGGVRSTGAGGVRVERRCRPGLNSRNDRYHIDRRYCGTTAVVVKYGTSTIDININHGEHAGHHASVDGPYDVFVGRVHSACAVIAFGRR